MGAGFAVSSGGTSARIFTDSGMTLQLSSTMPGVTFDGNTLVCPPLLITTSSGERPGACEFTISSIGSVAPTSVAVNVSVSGVTPSEIAASKFAISTHERTLVPFRGTSQTLYTFAGPQLPATVNPGIVWGGMAGTPLDNGDLGATIVVSYTVVAESLEGETASPVASPTVTPGENVGGETAAPARTATPPPTGSAIDHGRDGSTPGFALIICLFMCAMGLIAVWWQRRRDNEGASSSRRT